MHEPHINIIIQHRRGLSHFGSKYGQKTPAILSRNEFTMSTDSPETQSDIG